MAVLAPTRENLAQKRFDERYMTAAEIGHECKVSRVSVMRARARDLLPDAILVGDNLYIWERDGVKPYIDAWKTILDVRRRQPA